ncbi:hypothetical protein [Natronomonas amylolytica]|uniref:hypothetical protein n=1 Tax=Natronomonas amylolytica TaxID=3108498 RepID=UPI00300BA039
MSSSDEPRCSIAVCADCETVRPVEIRAGGEIRALGNSNCTCGTNAFELVE